MKDQSHADLESFFIYESLSTDNRVKLQSLFKPCSFSKNEVIFLKDDPGQGLYLVLNGRVKICVVDRMGNELIFTFVTKGDILGELAIFDGKPRSATAIAAENTKTLYLNRQEFLNFLQESPQVYLDIINVLCQRLRRLSNQLEDISFLDVAGRIARNLSLLASNEPQEKDKSEILTCSITQEDLSRLIGASREMVNKVLNSFVDSHLLTISRKKLTILNVKELDRIGSYDGDK
jgi:CRP/FNR family transcriptional regulator, cyclic AMP receptor protein